MENLINKQDVSRRMKMARIKAGHTQKTLAEALDVTSTTVYLWEKDPESVTLARFKQYAKACGVSVSYFFT